MTERITSKADKHKQTTSSRPHNHDSNNDHNTQVLDAQTHKALTTCRAADSTPTKENNRINKQCELAGQINYSAAQRIGNIHKFQTSAENAENRNRSKWNSTNYANNQSVTTTIRKQAGVFTKHEARTNNMQTRQTRKPHKSRVNLKEDGQQAKKREDQAHKSKPTQRGAPFCASGMYVQPNVQSKWN